MNELRALLVTAQPEVERVFSAVLESTNDTLFVAQEMSAAVLAAGAEQPALVFIDLTLPAATGLALVHHVLATHPKASIVALATQQGLVTAAEAISLGATGLLLLPPDGDAVLRAIGEVRARRNAEESIARLTLERGALFDQAEAMTRAVSVARGGNDREIAEALVALFVLASGARGAAFFGAESSTGTRQRLAAFGSGYELRDTYPDAELGQVASARSAQLHVFGPVSRPLGCALIERATATASDRTASAVAFAAALLMISARAAASIPPAPESQVVPEEQFARVLERTIEDGKPGLLVAMVPTPNGRVDLAKLPLKDEGALCGQRPDGSAWIVLPGRAPSDVPPLLLSIGTRGVGVAAFPSDGQRAAKLLSLAEARAREAARSPFYDLTNPGVSVGALAQALLRSASLESRVSSLFPLELSMTSLESLLAHTARITQRASRATPLSITVASADADHLAKATNAAFDAERSKVRVSNVASLPECEGVEAIVVSSPLASWALVGRWDKERLRAVHTCDPSTCAALAARILAAIGPGK